MSSWCRRVDLYFTRYFYICVFAGCFAGNLEIPYIGLGLGLGKVLTDLGLAISIVILIGNPDLAPDLDRQSSGNVTG